MAPEISGVLEDIINAYRAKAHEIHISTVCNGFRVQVGCKHFVFEDQMHMLEAISAYLNDPVDATKAFEERRAEVVGVDEPPPEPVEAIFEYHGSETDDSPTLSSWTGIAPPRE